MAKLEKMFGAPTKESRWKKVNKDHISEYNQNYYKANKEEIHARRKVQRATKRKTQHNSFLGF
ncbi:hypothetical protein HOV56_gp39 [Nitrosopumilus spindle-shaped virus]|uniref:Uncharacterized protein n=1 Tax=Nitrosopumilus spindle-shaped virus TaxID=2508184 RepID=A0A514K2X0_9VIRU|nr:hypothetical protein HOV56_gp39 [Nitrosopumilus spindle-shaped virus]YP_010772868.1 hypothetical protein QIT54_gp38 [Nitrosopumilus spindle-shaped virus]QDI73928.1 hypothetical protein [Nitrosopumilus spindle-shaped virus]QDI73976.1 hypothetical protein [Nitrosopumilus spindle-shaped virus]